MRRFVPLLLAIAVSVTGSAAAGDLGLSIHASGFKVLSGHDVKLSGRLMSGAAGRAVTIYGRPFGLGLTKVATIATRRSGAWSVEVRPRIATTYWARIATVTSRAVSIGVEPAVETRVLNGGVFAHVAGGRFDGRKLKLQRMTAAGWATIGRAVLNRSSSAFFQAPVGHGTALIRVAMSVNQAGAGYLGASSHPFVFRPVSLSLSAAAAGVRFGDAIALQGRLSSGRAGQRVSVLGRPYGSSAPAVVRTVRTDANGRWRLMVAPRIATSYEVRWHGIGSRALSVGVAPALTVTRLATGRLGVSIAPIRTFVGRSVELQRETGGTWKTIAQTALLGPKGRAVFTVPVASGRALLRVAMSVNEVGAGYLGTAGLPLGYRVPGVSIAPSTYKVLFGHSVTLAGNVSSGRSDRHVTILAWPYGRSAPVELGKTTTGPGGRWTFEARPSIRTSYTAIWGASKSRSIAIGVEPRVTVHVRSDGRIATRFTAGKAFRGRIVQLQQLLPSRQWSTIGRMHLDRHGRAVFAAVSLAGSPILRVAMSVNQAGVGLLGARSHQFAYRGV